MGIKIPGHPDRQAVESTIKPLLRNIKRINHIELAVLIYENRCYSTLRDVIIDEIMFRYYL